MQVLAVRKVGDRFNFSLISKSRKGIKVDVLHTLPANGELEKWLSLGGKNGRVERVVGLDCDQIFIRQLKVPVKSSRALAKVLPYQLESLIPFASSPDAEVVVTRQRTKEGFNVSTFAFLKRHLSECLERYVEVGMDPEWIGCVPQGLKRFARFVAPDTPSMIVCSVDEEATHIVSLIAGEIDVALTLRGKSEQELKRSIAYCLKRDEEGAIEGVLQLGCREFQKSDLGISKVELSNPSEMDEAKLLQFGLEIGLALDVALQDAQSLQLRRGKNIAKSQLRASVKMSSAILGGALIATLLLLGTSQKILSDQKRGIQARIEHCIGEDIGNFESSEAWIEVIDRAVSVLKKRGPSIGFHKRPRSVSELVAWISNHPDLQDEIEIQRLAYSLERYPNIGKPLDPFKVKVDLTLSASSPLIARDFQQALINQSEKFIDGKETVHWERGEGVYRAIFYLKNPF